MTKLDQIQAALTQINEAKFQKLCDAYLHKRGYGRVHPKGSVFGKEKTAKGTPDTWITLPSGKFAFVESTTQKSGLFGKLAADIEKCFDESKTSIPVSMIEKIILCHNGILEAPEEAALVQKCQEKGCLLENFGIDTLAFDLYQKYPSLASEYLGIEVDTGQILSPEDFIQRYQKNPFATRLDTGFFFREEELNQVAAALKISDVVVVFGKAGVGKSRFGLKCLSEFAAQYPDYTAYCIYNKEGLSIYADLKSYFTIDGRYVVLVDDANRISQLDQILYLINETNCDIKLIITTRDYALDKVRRVCREYTFPEEVELFPFNKKQLSEFISSEFGITNSLYLNRIWEVSRGNARLAVMAAKVSVETNRFDSLSDVTELYDVYFGSVTKDLDLLENRVLLQVAGIISFFSFIDRTRDDLMLGISNNFGISLYQVWENVRLLHSLEIVDLYESEIAKISDQVLATYLFFKAFIRDQLLDFSVLLEKYFDQYPNRFKDAVYPVINIFDRNFVVSRLQPHINQKWQRIEDDAEKMLRFVHVFWFLKTTDTLWFLKQQIDALELPGDVSSELNFKPAESVPEHSYLGVLCLFRFAPSEDFRNAFEMMLDYLEKRPSKLPEILHLLLEVFRFQKDSYYRAYNTQRIIIESLLARTESKSHGELYKRLFLKIASKYLESEFESTWMEERHTPVWQRFQLILSPELKNIRKLILEFLILLYQATAYRDEILAVLLGYSEHRRNHPVSEIIEYDSAFLLSLITTSLDPDEYRHCLIVQEYLHNLDEHSVPYDVVLKTRFVNKTYSISCVLLDDWLLRVNLEYEEYQKQKFQRIQDHFADYSMEDYRQFLDSCLEIVKWGGEGFHQGFTLVLINLADTRPELFKQVLVRLLRTGNQLKYFDYLIVDKLLSVCKHPQKTYDLLLQYEFDLKYSWLIAVLALVPQEGISQFFLNELYRLYNIAPLGQVSRGFDFLEKYLPLDGSVYIRIITTIFERVLQDDEAFSFLYLLRGRNTEVRLEELFADNVNLLKQIYFYEIKHQSLPDYDGTVFRKLIHLDSSFITEYLDWMYTNYDYLSYHLDRRDYSFLWRLDNYEQLVTEIVLLIYERSKQQLTLNDFTKAFFVNRNNDPFVLQRIKEYATNFIRMYHSNSDLMSIIFDVISELMQDQLVDFVALFLKHNQDYNVFRSIRFDALDPIAWGNQIPEHESRIKLLESLLPLLSSVQLLRHKLLTEERILFWNRQIEQINREAFIGDDW